MAEKLKITFTWERKVDYTHIFFYNLFKAMLYRPNNAYRTGWRIIPFLVKNVFNYVILENTRVIMLSVLLV